MLTMKSHGLEISIAGCVREIVRDRGSMSFFSFFFSCIIRSLFLGTRSFVQR